MSSSDVFHSVHSHTTLASGKINEEGILKDKTVLMKGFKEQYAPEGLPGCFLGCSETKYTCNYNRGSMMHQYGSPPLWIHKCFRVYIPKGTVNFALYVNQRSSYRYAYAMCLGRPPLSRAGITNEQFGRIKNSRVTASLPRLLEGLEVTNCLEAAETTYGLWTLTSTGVDLKEPLDKGQWLYLRSLLPESAHDAVSANLRVDPVIFAEGYADMTFDANGDPFETEWVDPPEVDPEPETPPFRDFTLTRFPSVGVEGSSATEEEKEKWPVVQVTAVPEGAVLPPFIVYPSYYNRTVSLKRSEALLRFVPGVSFYPKDGVEFTVTVGKKCKKFIYRK